jgi:hypothetical protein
MLCWSTIFFLTDEAYFSRTILISSILIFAILIFSILFSILIFSTILIDSRLEIAMITTIDENDKSINDKTHSSIAWDFILRWAILYICCECSGRSYFVRYIIILVTSHDCNHITWFRNSASVSLLATLSHRTWIANDFFIISTFSKSDRNFQIALFENFLTNENFSFLLIFCTRNRHSTMIEDYIRRWWFDANLIV